MPKGLDSHMKHRIPMQKYRRACKRTEEILEKRLKYELERDMALQAQQEENDKTLILSAACVVIAMMGVIAYAVGG